MKNMVQVQKKSPKSAFFLKARRGSFFDVLHKERHINEKKKRKKKKKNLCNSSILKRFKNSTSCVKKSKVRKTEKIKDIIRNIEINRNI